MSEFYDAQAYLFDLDETLASSSSAWSDAIREAERIHRVGITQDHVRACVSTSFTEVLKGLGVPDADIPRIVGTRNKVLPDLIRDQVVWKPGAEEVLDVLRSKKTAIATNSHDIAFNAMDEKLGLRRRVTRSFTWDDVGGKGKPLPDMVLKACQELGVPPDRALMIGDHANDKNAADAAGSNFLLVDSPNTPPELIHEHRVRSLEELLPFFR